MTKEEKTKANDGNYKAYTELISRLEDVKDAIKKQNYGIAMDILYKPYPEFQITIYTEHEEIEDEGIRKALIEFFELQDDNTTYSLVPKKDILAWLEKQGEQKFADKVEPKFHAGEWLIHKTIVNNPFCIIQVSAPYYYLTSLGSFIRFGEEKDYRPWTIQDAKDGDVLYSLDSKQPFIFKHRKTNEQANVYCGINIYGKFFVGNTKDCIITTDKYIPATKEQRDTFFAKMKEAGYEWDAKKMELKKIEQKIQPKFEVGDVMRTLGEAKEGITDGLPVVVSIDEEYYHCNNELIAIKDQDDYEYPPMNRRQKPTDKVKPKFKVGDCIRHKGRNESYKIVTIDDNYYFCENNHAWAIRSQNHFELVEQKPAWSEEDEKEVAVLEAYICSKDWSERHINRALGIVEELVGKVKALKFLKGRYIWKPSDEQMKYLCKYAEQNNYDGRILGTLYNDLKKLSEK